MRCLAVLVILAALATPRAAQLPAIPVADAAQPGVPPAVGAVATPPAGDPLNGPGSPRHGPAFPDGRSAGSEGAETAGGTPPPTSGIGSPLQGREGVIAQAVGHGSGYLAIPLGPGVLVRICGPAACLTLVSTDGGPNHAMLEAGRIADVALGHWLTLCGLPQDRGTCVGHWETTDALPATDTDG